MTGEATTIHPLDVGNESLPRELPIPGWAQRAVRFIEESARAGKTVTVTAEEETLTPAQMASEIGISRASIQRRIATGDIVSRKLGNRHRIPRREVEKFRASFILDGREGISVRNPGSDNVIRASQEEEVVGTISSHASQAPPAGEDLGSDCVDGMTVTRHLSDAELQLNLPLDLDLLRETLRSHRIERAWLFGSRSRGDHRAESDVDLLYRPAGEQLQLREYGRLVNALQDACPVAVDLADEIVDRMKPYIEADLVRIL